MHGHGGLAGARHALDDDVVVGGLADDLILFFLDGGHNLAEHGLLVLGQILGQQVVIGHDFAVEIVQELAGFDLIGALQHQLDVYPPVAGGSVAAFSQSVLVIGIGHGSTPVYDDLVGGVLRDAAPADIEGFHFVQRLVPEDNPPEIGLSLGLLIALQGPLHVQVHGGKVLQGVDQLRVVVMEMIQHDVDFRAHVIHLPAIAFQIVTDDGKGLFQESLLGLSGSALYSFLLLHRSLLPFVKILSISCVGQSRSPVDSACSNNYRKKRKKY